MVDLLSLISFTTNAYLISLYVSNCVHSLCVCVLMYPLCLSQIFSYLLCSRCIYVIVLFTFIQLITTVLAQLAMTVVCHLLSVVSFSPSVCLSSSYEPLVNVVKLYSITHTHTKKQTHTHTHTHTHTNP